MTLPSNILDYVIDALAIIAVSVLLGIKVVDKDVWMMVVLPIVGARAALRKPGGDGSGPVTPGGIVSLLGAIGFGAKNA